MEIPEGESKARDVGREGARSGTGGSAEAHLDFSFLLCFCSSAAIYGVRGKADISIFMLFPTGRVSAIQEAQMTSILDSNVHCLSVEGTFDDCQVRSSPAPPPPSFTPLTSSSRAFIGHRQVAFLRPQV